jgi:hypothetical protein
MKRIEIGDICAWVALAILGIVLTVILLSMLPG